MLIYRVERNASILTETGFKTCIGPYDVLHSMTPKYCESLFLLKFDVFRHDPMSETHTPIILNDLKALEQYGYSYLERVVDSNDYRYGFTSMNQLRNWFTLRDLSNLYVSHHFITIYDVPDEYCIVGHTQAVCEYAHMNLIDCIYINEYLKEHE